MLKISSIFLTLMMLLGIVGCDSPFIDAPQKTSPSQTHIVVKGGAKFVISLNKTSYSSGDDIVVHTEITNISDKPIAYSGSNSCDDGIHAYIPFDEHTRFAVRPKKGERTICAEVVRRFSLPPGQTVTDDTTLMAKIKEASTVVNVPVGKYKVHIELNYVKETGLLITVPIQITE